MTRLRIHILYEHGLDGQPFGSASIRLLRPLTYPGIRERVEVTTGLDYDGQAADIVIVDRLWRPDISESHAKKLLEKTRAARARLIYALDDDFLDLPSERKDWEPTEDHLKVVRFFLINADGILVTTPALQERLAEYNRNFQVVSHALDERLIKRNFPTPYGWPGRLGFLPMPSMRRRVIGYMGTHTHDDDLLMILPALWTFWRRHMQEIEFQFLGVIGRRETRRALKGLPFRVIHPARGKTEYTSFMPWFTKNIHWDIALAPLRDTAFNRCKSDIKFLDYCAIGTAGVFSRVPAYTSSVRHLETGWLANNEPGTWAEALDTLFSDGELRGQLANQATQYLLSNRTLAQRSREWVSALECLIDG